MSITTIRSSFVLGLAALVLAGCASTPEVVEPAPEPAPVVVAPEPAPEPVIVPATPTVSGGKLSVPIPGTDQLEMLQGVFYFDFDQAIVKRGGHAELDKHAAVLAADGSLQVRLEGHADERGTREYNLALGERRANAVRAYLVAQGAASSQIEVVSFGEEKPVSGGHDESSWALNRRVEIVYR